MRELRANNDTLDAWMSQCMGLDFHKSDDLYHPNLIMRFDFIKSGVES